MSILLALVITLAPQGVIREEVDVIEVNKYRNSFTQLIFRCWHPQLRRHDIIAWRLWRGEHMTPRFEQGRYVVRWHDGDILREVWTNSVRPTHTHYDPELVERDIIPQEQRRDLKCN